MSFPDQLPATAPASGVAAVTKGSALAFGTAGTLNFTTANGNVLTDFPALAGLLPIATASVQASGTADDIWALY